LKCGEKNAGYDRKTVARNTKEDLCTCTPHDIFGRSPVEF